MPEDLSFLPVQGNSLPDEDLSFLPVQKTAVPSEDLSFLPVQATPSKRVVTEIGQFDDKPSSFFEGIKSIPGRISSNIKTFREVPLESAAPLLAGARKGNIPIVSELATLGRSAGLPLPDLEGVVPKAIRPVTSTLAAPFDLALMGERLITDSIAGMFGEDPELTAGERGKRALTEDRFPAKRAIDESTRRLQPIIDKAVAAGVSPEEIKKIMVPIQTAIGTATDVVSGDALFRAIGAPSKLAKVPTAKAGQAADLGVIEKAVRGQARKPRLESIQKTRATQLAGRAERDVVKAETKSLQDVLGRMEADSPSPSRVLSEPSDPIKVVDKIQEPFTPFDKNLGKAAEQRRAAEAVTPEALAKKAAKERKVKRAAERTVRKIEKDARLKKQADLKAGNVKGSVKTNLSNKKGILSLPEKKELNALLAKSSKTAAETARVAFLQAKSSVPKGPKGESPIAKKVREEIDAQRIQQKIDKVKVKKEQVKDHIVVEGKKVKKTPQRVKAEKDAVALDASNIVRATKVKVKRFNKKTGKESIVEEFQGGTKVGNLQVGKLLAEGKITEKQAAAVVDQVKFDPGLLDKFPKVKDVDVGAQAVTKNQVEIIRLMGRLTPEERFAIPGVSPKIAEAVLDSPNLDPITKADKALEAILDWQMVDNAVGGQLRATGKVKSPTFLPKLRKLLDNQDIPKDVRKQIDGIIGKLEKGEERVNFWDVLHEIGVNNMLLGTVTIKRNLIGNTIGVGAAPGDKLGQALLSLIPGTRNKASFSEIPAIIAGGIKAIPKATSRGITFTRFGDTENILRHIQRKLTKLEGKPLTSKNIKKANKLRAKARFEIKEKDVSRASEARNSSGQSFTTRRVFGSKFEHENPKFTKIFDTLGAVANFSTRILSGGDKFFSEIARGGQSAALKVHKAMKGKPKGWKGDVKKIRLTKNEQAGVGEAALEFVFRDKMSKSFTAISNAIGGFRPAGVPVGKAIIPFFKTVVKLGRFAWNRSPFKFMEEAINPFVKRSPKGEAQRTFRGFDAKEGGKAINGSAMLLALGAYVWKNNGRFVGSERKKEGRDVVRMQDLEETRIEWLDKDGNVTGTIPMSNLMPATPFVSALAAIESNAKRVAEGEDPDDVFGQEANLFIKSMLQQSVYNNFNELNRATTQLMDEKVAVNEDGSTDTEGHRSNIQTYLKRMAAGRAIPAELREFRRTGKAFGFSVFEEDRRIMETSKEQVKIPFTDIGTGIPTLGAIGSEIASGLPRFKGVEKKGKARLDFTGKDADRSRRVTLGEILGGGRKPKDDKLLSELKRLKITVPGPPSTKAVSIGLDESVKTRLTSKEQRDFVEVSGNIINIGLRRFVDHENYDKIPVKIQRRVIKKMVSVARKAAGIKDGFTAFKRQMQSERGRRQLDNDTYEGFSTFFTVNDKDRFARDENGELIRIPFTPFFKKAKPSQPSSK